MDRNDAHSRRPPRTTDETDAASIDERGTENGEANPPHTTTGKITSPKFGAAGSGGAELEPGPERD